MKKIIICFISFIFFHKGYAQTALGIKGGANTSTVFTKNNQSGTPFETNIKGPVVGYYIGVFKNIDLVSKINFRPELLLSRKGFKSEMPHLPNNSTTTRFYYLNLPLMLSYKPTDKFSLLAGPEFGYLLKSSGKNVNGKEFESFDSRKKTDVGIALGLNYNLRPTMAVELRYSHGFTRLSPFKGLIDSKNRSIQLGLAHNILTQKKLLPTTPIR